jgi:hypothetical protein
MARKTGRTVAVEEAVDRFADLFEEGVELLKERDRLLRNPRVQRFVEVDARWRKILDQTNGTAHVIGHLVGNEHREKRARERKVTKKVSRRKAQAH